MSIINEALKKAVREKEENFSLEDREMVRRNIELEFQKKRSKFNWGPVFILLVLVLITGPIVAPIFSTPIKNSTNIASASEHSATQNIPASTATTEVASAPSSGINANRKAQFAVEEAPLTNAIATPTIISRTPDLTLSGIVYSAKQSSYCIINNQIVKVGDSIQGAKLISVSQDSAKLNYEGKEISLNTGSGY